MANLIINKFKNAEIITNEYLKLSSYKGSKLLVNKTGTLILAPITKVRSDVKYVIYKDKIYRVVPQYIVKSKRELVVNYKKDRLLVKYLVYFAWVSKYDMNFKYCIIHKNRDTLNNNCDNLKYISLKEYRNKLWHQ